MSFLIFAYRKLMLKRQINDLNFRQMVLSQKQQTITSQIGTMQQLTSAAKSMTNIFSQSAMSAMQMQMYGQYQNGEVPTEDAAKIQKEMYAKQMFAMQATQITNSIFDSTGQTMMAPLNAAGTQIDLEMASIESQLKAKSAELESVEKGETEAAKQSAPKFGLG